MELHLKPLRNPYPKHPLYLLWLGNLDIGDYTVATFTLSKSSGQRPGQRTDGNTTARTSEKSTIKVKVAYTDTRGERKTVDKEVFVGQSATATDGVTTAQFGRRTEQGFLTKYRWYLVGAALVLVAGGIYYSQRKKRLLEPRKR
jgi:hypothetical protein